MTGEGGRVQNDSVVVFAAGGAFPEKVENVGLKTFDIPKMIPLDYSQERLVWDAEFQEQLLGTIAQTGLAVAEAAGSPQDIEGAWAHGDCHIVQTRPQIGINHA